MEHPDAADEARPASSVTALVSALDAYPTTPAPIESLLREGSAVRRRRARRAVAATVAATVVLVGAGAVALLPHGSDERPVALDSNPAALAESTDGVQSVAIGRVSITLPRGWTLSESPCPNTGAGDKTVSFPPARGCVIEAVDKNTSDIAVTAERPPGRAGAAEDHGRLVDGHPLLEGALTCSPGSSGRQCTQTFGVPDLGAWFQVHVSAEAASDLVVVRDSLAVLPDGKVAIPPPDGADADEVIAALRDLGLDPVVATADCPREANCYGGTVTPAVGTVVDVGSKVSVVNYSGELGRARPGSAVPSCAPGTIPMLDPGDLSSAQIRTSSTAKEALRDLLPDADMSAAMFTPLGSGSDVPMWVNLGDRSYLVQANEPGHWYAVAATFEGCFRPRDAG